MYNVAQGLFIVAIMMIMTTVHITVVIHPRNLIYY